jgi:acyl carrier protein
VHNQLENTLATVEAIIKRFVPKRKTQTVITRETRLAEDLEIDSPRMIDIVLEVEDQFQISLEEVDAQKTATVGDLLDLIERKASRREESR